ncbi:MAG: hypothetical protein WD738_11290 [Pirellulales bacterium]
MRCGTDKCRFQSSHIQIPHIERVLLDEFAAGFDLVAHEDSSSYFGFRWAWLLGKGRIRRRPRLTTLKWPDQSSRLSITFSTWSISAWRLVPESLINNTPHSAGSP